MPPVLKECKVYGKMEQRGFSLSQKWAKRIEIEQNRTEDSTFGARPAGIISHGITNMSNTPRVY